MFMPTVALVVVSTGAMPLHFHLLLNRAQFQLDVDGFSECEANFNALAHDGFESGLFDRNRVRPRRQDGESVNAGTGGFHGCCDAGFYVRRRYARLGHHRAIGVGDGSINGAPHFAPAPRWEERRLTAQSSISASQTS